VLLIEDIDVALARPLPLLAVFGESVENAMYQTIRVDSVTNYRCGAGLVVRVRRSQNWGDSASFYCATLPLGPLLSVLEVSSWDWSRCLSLGLSASKDGHQIFICTVFGEPIASGIFGECLAKVKIGLLILAAP
jgi:hypothetical protein